MAACLLQQHADKIQPALWSVGAISELLSGKRISGILKSVSTLTDSQQPSRLEHSSPAAVADSSHLWLESSQTADDRGALNKRANSCGPAASKLLQLCDPSQKYTTIFLCI